MFWWRALSLAGPLLLVSCADPGAELETTELAVVYGADDRQDLFSVDDAQALRSAQSVVALIPRARLRLDDAGFSNIEAPTVASALHLCADVAFSDQPDAALCTGVLIDEDLVLTAGHCLRSDGCATLAFVFDYRYATPGSLVAIGPDDVYSCRSIVSDRIDHGDGSVDLDYAIVQLDRRVRGRRALPVAGANAPSAPAQAVTVIGCPSGTPLKVDRGAWIVDARAANGDYFTLNSDTFSGSSGAPVIDSTGSILGVFVRGNDDYGYDAGCGQTVRLPNPEPGVDAGLIEEATYAYVATQDLCRRFYPSRALCGVEPACGDGFCTGDETALSCNADCGQVGVEPPIVPTAPADDAAESGIHRAGASLSCAVRQATLGRGDPWLGWCALVGWAALTRCAAARN
jgi:V8-like Glu-specific endopeptidase